MRQPKRLAAIPAWSWLLFGSISFSHFSARAANTNVPSSSVKAKVIIVVRHADIDTNKPRVIGTALTEPGTNRAVALAACLKDSGVTKILTSTALRTQETARRIPGKRLEEVPESDESPKLVYHKLETCTADDIVLVVYHHTKIPGILALFQFPNEKLIGDEEFDRMSILFREPNGQYRLVRCRYGK
jgi:phosphohistidine phosphatase SixA